MYQTPHLEMYHNPNIQMCTTSPQAIPPLEFTVKNDKISLTFVDATIYSPVVAKGNICKDTRVFPAECRGRKCTYRGKIVVRLRFTCNPIFFFSTTHLTFTVAAG